MEYREENGTLKKVGATKIWANSFMIPEGVTHIKQSDFFGSPLATLMIPQSVTHTETLVFLGCMALKYMIVNSGDQNVIKRIQDLFLPHLPQTDTKVLGRNHPEIVKAANHNFRLGRNHAKGRGVPKDEKEAVGLYRLAAAQRNAKAQTALGVCCAYGKGVANPSSFFAPTKGNINSCSEPSLDQENSFLPA